jgi:DNA repair exonuclease SbcCD ATPase subunit
MPGNALFVSCRSHLSMSQREQSTTAGSAWADELAQRLDEQRRRMRAAVDVQNELARQWETSLQARLDDLHGTVQSSLDDVGERDAGIQAKLEALQAEEQRVAAQCAEVVKHRAELEALRESIATAHENQMARQQALVDDLARQLAQLNQREESLARDQASLAQDQAALAAEQAEVETLRRACDDTERLLADREASLQLRNAELARHAETCRQREEALAQRETTLRDREAVQQKREESLQQREDTIRQRDDAMRQRDDTMRQRDESLRERNELLRESERLVQAREVEVAHQFEQLKLHEQRTRSQRTTIAHELRARRKEMLAEAERQRAEAAQAAAGDEAAIALQLADVKVELSKLRAAEESHLQQYMALEEKYEQAKLELLDLHERLQTAESAPLVTNDNEAEIETYQRRLEMALSDVRELKQRNTELTEQMARNRAAPPPPAAHTGPMDWETRKQALLAQLESDFDENDPQQKTDKLTVLGAIQRTEEVLSAKTQEIAELQRLLTEQSGNIGGVAIGAAAIAEMFDSDELIRQERESLRDIQEKLREQLRQAEIDLSVERAKMARERAILEEKMRQFEDQKQQGLPDSSSDASDKSKKGGNRGRWLQRLGLKDEEAS